MAQLFDSEKELIPGVHIVKSMEFYKHSVNTYLIQQISTTYIPKSSVSNQITLIKTRKAHTVHFLLLQWRHTHEELSCPLTDSISEFKSTFSFNNSLGLNFVKIPV